MSYQMSNDCFLASYFIATIQQNRDWVISAIMKRPRHVPAMIREFRISDQKVIGAEQATSFSCLQQAPLQEILHVTTPIGDQKHIDLVSHDPVDDTVGFEEDLVELPQS